MPLSQIHIKLSCKSLVRQFLQNGVGRGYLVVVKGSTRQLLGLLFAFYCASQKKVYAFQKCTLVNISKYFQEIFIHVGSYGSLLSNDTNISDNILCLSEQEPHLWKWPKSRLDRNWYLFWLLSANIESREKASKLSFWWSDDNLWEICFAVCISWQMPSTFYAASSY